jgi:cytochrome c553
MKKVILSLLLTLGFTQVSVAVEGSVEAGKAKSAMCAACHGPTGKNTIPTYPDLAGQHAPYIVKQLQGFQDGTRSDPMMSPMAANLSEQDMADLAAYFSSFPWKEEVAATSSSGASAVSNTASSAAVTVEVNTTIVSHNGGDAVKGQEKSATCAACHGADGNSLITMYPKLAGQGSAYIQKQLSNFKSGERVNAMMAGMVAGLSEQDMADLGAFFATQKTSTGNGEANEAGRKLYYGGDSERAISACVACHTASGKGAPQARFPAIAGQNVEYLTGQLKMFRSGERANDTNGMMRNIAIKLSDKDIDALAQFMSSMK